MSIKLIKEEEFNTTNAWGFAGGVGVEKSYDNGLSIRKGKSYYRHTPPSSFTSYYLVFNDGEETHCLKSPNDNKFKKLWLLKTNTENKYRLISAKCELHAKEVADKYFNKYLYFEENYLEITEIELP